MWRHEIRILQAQVKPQEFERVKYLGHGNGICGRENRTDQREIQDGMMTEERSIFYIAMHPTLSGWRSGNEWCYLDLDLKSIFGLVLAAGMAWK